MHLSCYIQKQIYKPGSSGKPMYILMDGVTTLNSYISPGTRFVMITGGLVTFRTAEWFVFSAAPCINKCNIESLLKHHNVLTQYVLILQLYPCTSSFFERFTEYWGVFKYSAFNCSRLTHVKKISGSSLQLYELKPANEIMWIKWTTFRLTN